MSGVRGHVHRRGGRFQRGEEVCDRERRSSVLPDHDGRDALAHGGQRGQLDQEAAVVVAVGVDETRGEYQSGGVVDVVAVGRRRSFAGSVGRHLGDRAANDAHRSGESGAAGAVDDGGAADHERALVGGDRCAAIAPAGGQQRNQDAERAHRGWRHVSSSSCSRVGTRTTGQATCSFLRCAFRAPARSRRKHTCPGPTCQRFQRRYIEVWARDRKRGNAE